MRREQAHWRPIQPAGRLIEVFFVASRYVLHLPPLHATLGHTTTNLGTARHTPRVTNQHHKHAEQRGQIAFRRGDRQLEYLEWQEANLVDVLFRGQRADQGGSAAVEKVRERTRDEVHGPHVGVDIASPDIAG